MERSETISSRGRISGYRSLAWIGPYLYTFAFRLYFRPSVFYSPPPLARAGYTRSDDYPSKITFYFRDKVVASDSELAGVYDPAIRAACPLSIKPRAVPGIPVRAAITSAIAPSKRVPRSRTSRDSIRPIEPADLFY